MKINRRFFRRWGMAMGLFLAFALPLLGQEIKFPAPIQEIEIRYAGPKTVGEDYVRSHIRLKKGDSYTPGADNDDIKNLKASGRFHNIRTALAPVTGGIKLIYEVQCSLNVTSVTIQGVEGARVVPASKLKIKLSKLEAALGTKVGAPLSDVKLFLDRKALADLYLKDGYHQIQVEEPRQSIKLDDGTVEITFRVYEGEKVKIDKIEMTGAKAFTADKLKGVVKTRERRRWWNPISWFTGDGKLIADQIQDDVDALIEHYQSEGFLDAAAEVEKSTDKEATAFIAARDQFRVAQEAEEAATVKLARAKRANDKLVIETAEKELDAAEDKAKDARKAYEKQADAISLAKVTFKISEGARYRVGTIKIEKARLEGEELGKLLFPAEEMAAALQLRSGAIFRPSLANKDEDSIREYYGSRGYANTRIGVRRAPNVQTGAMDIVYLVTEGAKTSIEQIRIEGNEKTKDLVIRRELAIAPGEQFDLGRMRLSEQRIEGLRLFERVKVDYEPIEDQPGRANVIVSVAEKDSGRFGIGAGFSTDFGVFGNVSFSQENFDLLRWKTPHLMQGAGQKLRVNATVGSELRRYELQFIEPWLLGRKLELDVNLFSREQYFYSQVQTSDRLYTIDETGASIGVTRTLGNDFLRGSLSYSLQSSGLTDVASTASSEIAQEAGRDMISKFGGALAYDTRNAGVRSRIPDAGQKTQLSANVAGGPMLGDADFYGVDLFSAWYFKGFGEDHVIELVGQTSVVNNFGDSTRVPLLHRHFLGGSSNLRGFGYRQVGPRDANGEPVGGKTMYRGTLEYSVPTPLEILRAAAFYDVGGVSRDALNYDLSGRNDNWGLGLRIDIPFLGPLRMDYGFPIKDDGRNGGGQLNVSFGYTTAF